MVKGVVLLGKNIVRVRVESHADVPVRTPVRAADTEHAPQHCRITGNQFIGPDASKWAYLLRQ